MDEDLTARGQSVLDASIAKTIGPATIAVALGYLASALVHVFLGHAGERGLAVLELASVALLFFLGRRRARDPRRRALILAAVILANNLAYHVVNPSAAHTPVLYLVTLGAGVIAGIPRGHYAAMLAGSFEVQWLSIALSPDPVAAWAEPAITLVAFSVLGITLRYHTHARLRQISALQLRNEGSLRALDSSITQFREIAERANDLISEIDEEGRVLYANPAHATLLGVDPENLVGMKAFEELADVMRVVDGPDLARLLAAPFGPFEIAIPEDDSDRPSIVIEMNSRPFESSDGGKRVVVTAHDVTGRVTREAEQERYREVLEREVAARTQELTASVIELQRRERLAAVGTLAAGIAHQINNPIGGILLSAQFALAQQQSGHGDVESLTQALEVNIEEARRCGEIVKHLLRFARNEPSERRVIDLGPIVDRVADLCRPYAASRDGSIQVSIPTSRLVVSANPVEIEESLINLIRNALESQEKGATVGVTLAIADGSAEILVSDDGPGISEEQQRHVFDPFYTTRLREGGTGLGLSVARDIALDHGGGLEIESDGVRGTSVRVTLPLATTNLDSRVVASLSV